ncbi:hypothetical protein [Microvirga arabica]|uniref:hypothetical protein n=1 Tax=Microvirga arabica TaxID=1128671 RepID=UPI00193AA519|nr:hypothetical protein [Microvirga arabica]MBM1169865.1 hypothetical protein [Microvirga arabica]
METNVIESANQLIIQRVAARYLAPAQESYICVIEGACVTTRRSWNRYGVPTDATCWRHVFEHPQYGWSFAVRSVWRDERLHEPVAVHTVITDYYIDDTNLIGDEAACIRSINEWMQTVPL